MKNAFTMIELIFLIVIISILAAVAIPKLASMSVEANKTLVVEYVGMLNTTIRATMYTEAVNNVVNPGEIVNATYCGVLATEGNDYLEPIDQVDVVANCELTVSTDYFDTLPAINTFTDGNPNESAHWTFKW